MVPPPPPSIPEGNAARFGRRLPTGAALGVTLMVAATLMFSSTDALVRVMAQQLPPFEVAFFRSFFGLMALTPLFVRQGTWPFRTNRLRLHILRALLQGTGMFGFFTGITMIPLAEVTALSFQDTPRNPLKTTYY